MRLAALSVLAIGGGAFAGSGNVVVDQKIGLVDFDGAELGLLGYTNSALTAIAGPGFGTSAAAAASSSTTWGPGDAFWSMSRLTLGPGGIGMPFAQSDDSVVASAGNTVFANDNLGLVSANTAGSKTDGYFGVTDTENGSNSGPVVATWRFDVTGFTGLSINMDFGAIGDFEAADSFVFDASMDGGATFTTIFSSSVDEAGSKVYEALDSGFVPTLDDPLSINGVMLSREFQNISASLDGVNRTGDELIFRFTAESDGGTEAFGFDNINIRGVPTPGAAALLAIAGAGMSRRRRA